MWCYLLCCTKWFSLPSLLDKICKCHHSNESYWAVISCSTVFKVKQDDSSFWAFGWNAKLQPFKWKLCIWIHYVNCGHTNEIKMWSSQLWCFQGFNGIRTHGLCVSTVVLHQLSYQHPYVGNRPIYWIEAPKTFFGLNLRFASGSGDAVYIIKRFW